MDEFKLAGMFYRQAVVFADDNAFPRSAAAKAMFHAALQIFIEKEGPEAVGAWLSQQATEYETLVELHAELIPTGGNC